MEEYNYDKNDVYEISIREIFKILKSGLKKTVIVAVVCGIVSFAFFNFLVPKTYTAKLKLYVEAETTGDSLVNHNYAAALVETYVNMLSTNTFFEKLSGNLDEQYSAKELSKIVSFSVSEEKDSEFFFASVSGKAPLEAKIIADATAEIAPEYITSIKKDNYSLKIADNATMPTSPSSPNVMRNTLIAMGAGAVVMIFIVFLREVLDKKIRYSPEITEIRGLPVLSAVPDFGSEGFMISTETEEESVESEA